MEYRRALELSRISKKDIDEAMKVVNNTQKYFNKILQENRSTIERLYFEEIKNIFGKERELCLLNKTQELVEKLYFNHSRIIGVTVIDGIDVGSVKWPLAFIGWERAYHVSDRKYFGPVSMTDDGRKIFNGLIALF